MINYVIEKEVVKNEQRINFSLGKFMKEVILSLVLRDSWWRRIIDNI